MNISEFAVRRPVTTAVIVIGVLVFGVIALNRLSIDLLPDLQLPQVTIATVYPGADPRTVEEEVTRPIEDTVAMTAGVQRVTSVSMENVSVVTVEFDWGVNVSAAIEDLRAQLAALSFLLPADAQDPLVLQLDLSQLPVVIIGVSAEGDQLHATGRALTDVRPLLEQVPGVAQVAVVGGAEREIQVLYDPDKLAEHELTPAILEQFLALQNAMVPGGVIENNGVRYSTRIGNHFTDVQQIRDLVIGESRLPVQGLAALWPPLLYVKDVAEVVDGVKDPTGYARVDGRPTVLLQVLKRPGANTVAVARGVHAALARLQQDHPDLGLTVVLDQSVQIQRALRNLAQSGVIGAVVAVAVLFLFLRHWRSIAVIASAIPLSIVVTFVLMYFADMNLNLMTLGGLALGVGMLGDNAIIVLENFFRHRSEGLPAGEAAVTGAKEVGGAVLAATLTTVAVFLPVVFMDTFVGQLFKELGLTVSLASAASLLVSLTVVPVTAARMLRSGVGRRAAMDLTDPKTALPEPDAAGSARREAAAAAEGAAAHGRSRGLTALYDGLLQKALDRRGWVLGGAAALLVATALLWPHLGIEFLPEMGSRTLFITMEMPPGTPLSETDAVAREAERRLSEMPELAFVAAQVGQQQHDDLLSLMQGHQTNTIQIMAYVPETVRTRDLGPVMDAAKARLADLPVRSLSVARQWQGGGNPFSNDLIVQVRGVDMDALESVARDLDARLRRALGDRAEVRLGLAEQQPEVFLEVDQSRALIGGLSTAQISLAVRNALSGVQATHVRQNGQTVPVVVKPHPDRLQNLDDLLDYRVSSPVPMSLTDTTSIRLSNVVRAVEQTGPQSIRRVDGARAVELTVRPARSDVRDLTRIVDQVVAEAALPPGVTVTLAGLSQMLSDAWDELGTVLLLAVALVYLVMAAQFESWRYPLIIMVTVPLAAMGSLWAMFLTGTNLGVASLIGVMMLVGVVVNNGIVLVDYTGILARRGMPVRDAVVTAARRRLRPVLMTAITTIGGMIPMALGQEQGMELQGPLAITVIGGLTASTVLTLFVVPILYVLLSGSSGRSPEGGRQRSRRGRAGAAIIIAGVALAPAAAWAPAAAAQPETGQLTLVTGIGWARGDEPPLYLLGAGWDARWADTDWSVHVAAAAGPETQRPVLDLGLEGSWFQPISFAGYYELQGRLSVRRDGDGPVGRAFALQGDAVLGNITGRIAYESVTGGFPALPWDEPGRLAVAEGASLRRHLSAELRQQPHRELNLLREFAWSRSYGTDDDGHVLLLGSGAEVRAAGGWLLGKLGLVHRDDKLEPLFAGGFRIRPGPYSHLAVTAASATALTALPTLRADYELIGERAAFNATLELTLDEDNRLQPALFLQSIPHAGGFRWQLGVGAPASDKTTTFGLFTSF